MRREDHLTIRPEARKIRSKGVLVQNENSGISAWIPYEESPYDMIDSAWDEPKLYKQGSFASPDPEENRHLMKVAIDVFIRRMEAMDEINEADTEQLEFANENLEKALEKVEQKKETI